MATTASVVLAENASAVGGWKLYAGGHSIFTIIGTWTGTVSIETLGPDGVTAVPVLSLNAPARTANINSACGNGLYRFNPGTATGVSGVWATIERVPS